ncbi:hypothetical protein KAR91_67595 [Candidatus Pacearchaeota archaeon]|nr:hypothetical protein [Candidatus Pacearchaeota archaeon]
MVYTKSNTDYIYKALIELPFIKSVSYVGRIDICGSSDHDVDLLVEFSIPNDWQTMTDKDINDRLIDHMNTIVETIGEKEGTCRVFSYMPSGQLPWVNYSTKIPIFDVLVSMCFITPSDIPIDVYWVVGKSASSANNPNYFADKVKWRIDGGCP